MELKDLKEIYSSLEKKYNLPSFQKVNLDFDIDKIDRDSDNTLKNIRKVMMEKIINSLNFIEMLTNPVNAPRMYMAYVKSMSVEDKKLIEEMYSVLSSLSLDALTLEIDSSEKNESEVIKKIFALWQEQKPSFRKLFGSMKHPIAAVARKEKSYFG